MSFADKVAALRDFFVTPSDAALPLQVAMMNEQMGIDGEGARGVIAPRMEGNNTYRGGHQLTCL